MDRLIAKDLMEKASAMGGDVAVLVDALLNHDSPWQNMRRGEFGFNVRATARILGWDHNKVREVARELRTAIESM